MGLFGRIHFDLRLLSLFHRIQLIYHIPVGIQGRFPSAFQSIAHVPDTLLGGQVPGRKSLVPLGVQEGHGIVPSLGDGFQRFRCKADVFRMDLGVGQIELLAVRQGQHRAISLPVDGLVGDGVQGMEAIIQLIVSGQSQAVLPCHRDAAVGIGPGHWLLVFVLPRFVQFVQPFHRRSSGSIDEHVVRKDISSICRHKMFQIQGHVIWQAHRIRYRQGRLRGFHVIEGNLVEVVDALDLAAMPVSRFTGDSGLQVLVPGHFCRIAHIQGVATVLDVIIRKGEPPIQIVLVQIHGTAQVDHVIIGSGTVHHGTGNKLSFCDGSSA